MSLTLAQYYYRKRSAWYKHRRLLFSSPAEVKLIRLLGGTVWTWGRFTNKNGFPLTVVLYIGRILKRENAVREYRVGSKYVDLGFVTKYGKKGIEVDSDAYHSDIVVQQERDDYFYSYGVTVLHIKPSDISATPQKVRKEVIKFLAR